MTTGNYWLTEKWSDQNIPILLINELKFSNGIERGKKDFYFTISKKLKESIENKELIPIDSKEVAPAKQGYWKDNSSSLTGLLDRPRNYIKPTPAVFKSYFDKKAVIDWAINKGLDCFMPNEFNELVSNSEPDLKAENESLKAENEALKKQLAEQNKDALLEYLNESHECYSHELALAIKAWQAVLSSNPDRPKEGSRKSLIERWLEENHSKLKNNAIQRIATLLNPDKSGGVSKSE